MLFIGLVGVSLKSLAVRRLKKNVKEGFVDFLGVCCTCYFLVVNFG